MKHLYHGALHIVKSTMLMELTVIPLGRGRSLSADLADVIGQIDQSGLPYRVTPFGTLLEGTGAN